VPRQKIIPQCINFRIKLANANNLLGDKWRGQPVPTTRSSSA
jgi:hypothetical protein